MHGYTLTGHFKILLIQLNIISSDLANYPESDNNLLLVYSKSPSTQRISIQSIIPKMEKNYYITDMNIYLCLGSAEGSATYVFEPITKEAKHKVYKIHGGEKAHLLYDLSIEQGIVFVRICGFSLQHLKSKGYIPIRKQECSPYALILSYR